MRFEKTFDIERRAFIAHSPWPDSGPFFGPKVFVGGMGHCFVPDFGLHFMVSQVLQKSSLKGLAQYTALYSAGAAGAGAVALVLDLSRIFFLAGLVFAPFYVALFYVSALLIFKRNRQKPGYALLLAKQTLFLLVCALLYWLGEPIAFLVGSGAVLPPVVFWLWSRLLPQRNYTDRV